MRLAIQSEFEDIKLIFYKHKKWFPHIRTDYMRRMIEKKRLIYQDGVIITFHHAARKQKIGNVPVNKGETILHQIANKESGNGNAKKILLQFFDWCEKDVYLSVRADNLTANRFYVKMNMNLIGKTTWAKGTLPGNVYVKRKRSNKKLERE